MAIISTGPVSTGINIPRGSFATGQAIIAGSFADAGGTGVEYTGNELIEIHGTVGSVTEDHPMIRLRNCGNEAANMTTGTVTTLQVQAYGGRSVATGRNIAAFQAIEAHVGIKGDSTVIADLNTYVPNMRAAWLKIEDLGYNMTLTGTAACIVLEKQFNTGTTLTGDSAYIWLASEGNSGYNLNAIIQGKDGTGSGLATNFLEIPDAAPVAAGGTGDITFGDAWKKIKVTLGTTAYYLVASVSPS